MLILQHRLLSTGEEGGREERLLKSSLFIFNKAVYSFFELRTMLKSKLNNLLLVNTIVIVVVIIISAVNGGASCM